MTTTNNADHEIRYRLFLSKELDYFSVVILLLLLYFSMNDFRIWFVDDIRKEMTNEEGSHTFGLDKNHVYVFLGDEMIANNYPQEEPGMGYLFHVLIQNVSFREKIVNAYRNLPSALNVSNVNFRDSFVVFRKIVTALQELRNVCANKSFYVAEVNEDNYFQGISSPIYYTLVMKRVYQCFVEAGPCFSLVSVINSEPLFAEGPINIIYEAIMANIAKSFAQVVAETEIAKPGNYFSFKDGKGFILSNLPQYNEDVSQTALYLLAETNVDVFIDVVSGRNFKIYILNNWEKIKERAAKLGVTDLGFEDTPDGLFKETTVNTSIHPVLFLSAILSIGVSEEKPAKKKKEAYYVLSDVPFDDLHEGMNCIDKSGQDMEILSTYIDFSEGKEDATVVFKYLDDSSALSNGLKLKHEDCFNLKIKVSELKK